jgi:hypothetical protein
MIQSIVELQQNTRTQVKTNIVKNSNAGKPAPAAPTTEPHKQSINQTPDLKSNQEATRYQMDINDRLRGDKYQIV